MTVPQAYAETLRITRREARSFAWGIALLPRAKREAVAALYAFARRVDDIADDATAPSDLRRRRLDACRRDAEALPAGGSSSDPVLVALADAVARYGIPVSALTDLVDGGLMDVERTRYATWGELREYCRRVAGSVGVACAAVYGPRDHDAPPRAETLGIALQQINIMRDVPEDWRLGRVYLPQDELVRFGVSEDDIAAGRTGGAWQALMEHQATRADALLADGLRLLRLLDARSALSVRAFAGVYRGLLAQMRSRRFDVFSGRPTLSSLEKIRAVAATRAPSRDGAAPVR
jgi:15-cis-phytoene synthase